MIKLLDMACRLAFVLLVISRVDAAENRDVNQLDPRCVPPSELQLAEDGLPFPVVCQIGDEESPFGQSLEQERRNPLPAQGAAPQRLNPRGRPAKPLLRSYIVLRCGNSRCVMTVLPDPRLVSPYLR